jgi:hypothetical protein
VLRAARRTSTAAPRRLARPASGAAAAVVAARLRAHAPARSAQRGDADVAERQRAGVVTAHTPTAAHATAAMPAGLSAAVRRPHDAGRRSREDGAATNGASARRRRAERGC